MHRVNLTKVAGSVAGSVLALLLAFQSSAQGQSGGPRPGGASGGAVNAGGLGNATFGVDRAWPRGPEVQAPTRLPQDKAFGEKGKDASAKKAANASSDGTSAAETGCVEAKAAIAAAGTGGTTDKGQSGDAGADGRANAAAAVCSGANAEAAASAGQSAEAPGHTGVTGVDQATSRADEHAEDALEKARSNEPADAASDTGEKPEQQPPQ